MSKNRLPRWLSEGLSVWEERRARPEWGREMDMSFAQAINENKVLKLKVLNEGFSDPQLISLSYYQASLVVDHIVDTYGEPKLRDLIRSYGEGYETEMAVKEVLGVSLDQLQTGFDARLEKQYASLRKSLQTPKFDQADARRSQEDGREQSGELCGADATRHRTASGEGSEGRDSSARASREAGAHGDR